jgi:hypothetical protein
MALSYTKVDIRGVAYKEVLGEILFSNNTLEKGLVTFADNIKANSVFTDTAHVITLAAYTSGLPTAAGTIGVVDKIVTPYKFQAYDVFDMETLRTGRFNRDMKAGAWNMESNEFTATVLNGIAPYISRKAEDTFWNGAKAATATAVAALTSGTGNTSVGAAEQTYVAAAPVSLIDGVVTKMIYNTDTTSVGARQKVAGTTITAANIFTEYGKLYTGTNAAVLHDQNATPYIYAPYSHLAFIRQYNTANTYKSDVFVDKIVGNEIYFQGIPVVFVPLPENCMILATKQNIVWCTDLLDDTSYLEIGKVYLNADQMFYKAIFTEESIVRNQKFNTLYLG